MVNTSFFIPDYVPPPAFHFAVVFPGNPSLDSSFQEVSGLKVTLETTEKMEGGDNVFVHQLPKSIKYNDLVLKRCLMKGSNLESWCRDAIENLKFKPLDISLRLVSSKSEANEEVANVPLAVWSFEQAFPISWELTFIGTAENEFEIEALTLKYRKFTKTL